MLKPQQYVLGAIALCVLVTLAYCRGVEKGKTDERLSSNKQQIAASDSVTKSVTSAADSARKKADALGITHTVIRGRARIVHDTVIVDDSEIYADPVLVQIILTADSTIAAQKRALALQDTLVASLRYGIALRDTRIKLLESRGTSRISRGVQVGVGYCQNATGRTPCAYAGFGVQVKLP